MAADHAVFVRICFLFLFLLLVICTIVISLFSLPQMTNYAVVTVFTLALWVLPEAMPIANIKESRESLERELLLMNLLIGSVEAMVDVDQNAAKWMEETSIVARRAEDLLSHYEKCLAKRKEASIFKWPYLKERHELAFEIDRVTLEIREFSEKGKQILTERNLNLPPSSQEAGGNVSDSAFNKLNVFLSQNWLYPEKLSKSLRMLRDEMAPLDKFLRDVGAEAALDERQKFWVQEIIDIFQLLEESLPSFQCSREKQIKFSLKYFIVELMYFLVILWKLQEKEFSNSIYILYFLGLLHLYLQWKLRTELGKKIKKIMEIEKRITAATRRYHFYAIGEFKIRGGLRSVVPQIRSHITVNPVKSSSMMAGDIPGVLVKLLSKKPTLFGLEQFRMDLKLMKALFVDASRMGDSDKRIKVWLEQMAAIYHRLETLDTHAKETSEGRMGVCKTLGLLKIARETKEIEKEIHDALVRKMRYDIGSFVAENGDREVQSMTEVGFGQSTSSGKLKEQTQLMKELQLMDALLEDVSTMEKLDARLKVWLQEILGVAREAKAIVQQDFRGIFGRIKVARKMNKISKWIDDISEWKMTYDIWAIKATRGSSTTSHDLEAAEAYPSGIVGAEFESLRKELKIMKALDDDIQEVVSEDGKLEVWMEEMRDVAKDAEKLIDKHGEITRKRGIAYFLHLLTLYGEFIIKGKRLNSILHFKDKIKKLNERRIRYGIEQTNRIPANINGEVTSVLLSDIKHLCILPILDLKGTGIAGLRELITYGNAILSHFEWCLWVTIPEEFHSLSILRAVIDQVKEQEKNVDNSTIESLLLMPKARQKEIWSEEEEMMQKLEDLLIQKRYLIVLDGIRSVEAWHYFQKAFPDASNGSRILLATHSMVESKWRHLCQNLDLDMQKQQRMEIGRHGEFLLLTPLKIGRLLPTNETVSDWERLLMQLNEEETSQQESSAVSHENIPSYLWRCLFYFLLFPAGMVIPARRLIALWVAEGLISPKRGENKPAEYFCELYLFELIRRRLIKATKRTLNGKVKACQLCDDMQETLLKKAEEANFFQDASAMTFRLVVHHANRNTSYDHINGSKPCFSSVMKANYKKVISFFSFDTEEGGKHGKDIGNFLYRCISNSCLLSLRVLDLERVFKPKLPAALGMLTGLRYLGLRWTYLEFLPDHVSKLLNLQVLDVKRTYISTLPKSIWRMQYLRHLYLSETYRTRFFSRPKIKSLTDLLTLWGAFVDEDSPVSDGLDTILNVRKLGLTCRSMSSTDEMKSQLVAVGDWILKLEHLEHLRLKSFDDCGNPSDLHLKPLSRHKKLSTVYLVGRLRYSIVSEFPVNLTDITLSGSELEKDPMITLQCLQKLIILQLLSRSTNCRTMRCTKGGFPQLRILKIWNLEHLEEWELEKGALLSLKDLEIRNCKNLKMIPYEVTCLERLREFKLSDEFAEMMRTNQPIVWDKIEHLLKVDTE